jgi:hypothetical protein
MTTSTRVNRYALYFCVLLTIVIAAGITAAQSTDETRPTPLSTFPVTGNLGSGTYYYSVRTIAGRAKVLLEFTPPDGGGSMSVSISGPDCCIGDAYVGADSGLPDPVRREGSFDVRSPQTLLVTVYVAVAAGRTIRFSLNLGGSIGDTPPPATRAVCTDLAAISGFGVAISGTTRTITGEIRSISATDFRSPAERQWIEILDISKGTFAPVTVQRVPFTEVLARGRVPFTVRHTTASRLAPNYQIKIVYSPLNATDSVTTNDDCNHSNDSALRRPIATI